MRLIIAVALLCGLVTVAVVTRSAAVLYFTGAGFVVSLLCGLVTVRTR